MQTQATEAPDRLENAKRQGQMFLNEIVALHDGMKAAEQRKDDNAREECRDTALEMALSVEVRDSWRVIGSEGDGASEYRILLSTGGPACCIMGDIATFGEPSTAKLYVQDWFQPWTEIDATEVERDALMAFVECYCFEE